MRCRFVRLREVVIVSVEVGRRNATPELTPEVCADTIPDVVAVHAIAHMRPQRIRQNTADSLPILDRPILTGTVVDAQVVAINALICAGTEKGDLDDARRWYDQARRGAAGSGVPGT